MRCNGNTRTRCRPILGLGRFSFLTLALLVMILPPCRGQAVSAHDSLESYVDGLIEGQISAYHLAGVTVAVVQDSQTSLVKGYGTADVSRARAVDPHTTLFRVGSISKVFVNLSLLQLAQAGRLDLDAPIARYIDFPLDPSCRLPVRVRDLMNHTAGFEDRFEGMWNVDPKLVTTPGEFLRTHQPACIWPPGREASYSNYGATLSGYIVERIAGMPFEQYVEEHVFRPLGMMHTTFREDHSGPGEFAEAHEFSAGRLRVRAPEYIGTTGPAGAMRTTAADMAVFMNAMLARQDTPILEYATLRRLYSDTTYQPQKTLPGLAYGLMQLSAGPWHGIGHDGRTRDFLAGLAVYPQVGVGIFISYNSADARHACEVFTTTLVHHLQGYRPAVPVITLLGTTLGLAGTYRSNRHAYTTPETVLQLGHDVEVRAQDPGQLILREGDHEARYLAAGGDGFVIDPSLPVATWASKVGFVRDTAGRGATLAFAEDPTTLYKRVPWWGLQSTQLLCLAIPAVSFLGFFLALALAWSRVRRALRTVLVLAGAMIVVFVVAMAALYHGVNAMDDFYTTIPRSIWWGGCAAWLGVILGLVGAATFVYRGALNMRPRYLSLTTFLAFGTGIGLFAFLAAWRLVGI